MTTFNNQDLQSKFDDNGYIAINPLFSIDKIEEIKIELSRYIKEVTPNVPDHHIFYENTSFGSQTGHNKSLLSSFLWSNDSN